MGLAWGDVQGRVAVEGAERLEPERDDVRGHDRPVLWAGDVVDTEHVPEDWPVIPALRVATADCLAYRACATFFTLPRRPWESWSERALAALNDEEARSVWIGPLS